MDIVSLCNDRRIYTALGTSRSFTFNLVAWHLKSITAYQELMAVLEKELSIISSSDPGVSTRESDFVDQIADRHLTHPSPSS